MKSFKWLGVLTTRPDLVTAVALETLGEVAAGTGVAGASAGSEILGALGSGVGTVSLAPGWLGLGGARMGLER